MTEQTTDAARVGGVVERRPLPTPAQVKTLIEAMFTAKRVAPEIIEQRIAICRQCDKRRVTPQGVEWCRNCGCRVSSKSKEIMNLAAYEENLPKWGCKHPQRKQGKGWKEEGRVKKEEGNGGSGQTAGGSGQTTGGFSQTTGSAGQLDGGFGQTARHSGQMDGVARQTPGGFRQLAGGSGQLPGSSGQMSEGSRQLSGSSRQMAATTV